MDGEAYCDRDGEGEWLGRVEECKGGGEDT